MTCGKGDKHGEEHISCKEICQFLCDYVDHELPAAQRESFLQHMRDCPPCAEYLRQYEGTIKACKRCMCPGHAKPPPPPDDLVNAIMKAMGKSCSK